MYVKHRWYFPTEVKQEIKQAVPQFGYNGFGEVVYYRTYSRNIEGIQEHWADTCIRTIEGIMSIRYDYYRRNRIYWDTYYWQDFAYRMLRSMFRMEWLPSGRGLWAMGTDLIYERGGMALYNCAYTEIGFDWIDDLSWIMDSLMYGVGVGFQPIRQNITLQQPESQYQYTVPDSREGWVESVRRLLMAYQNGTPLPVFDYSIIRPGGALIKSFGGTASGPAPLKDLHTSINDLCCRHLQGSYDSVMFLTDLANLIGVCVVTGNTRRSAQIAIAPVTDPIFMDLKNYDMFPERASWGWMSNNSVILNHDDDFEYLKEIAWRNVERHDIGYINMQNLGQGRIGKNDELSYDEATGINPCGEIPLENRETCNVVETFPTRCSSIGDWLLACQYATFYASTVALLPTHQPRTNEKIFKNRRIGVSLADFTGWKYQHGVNKITKYLREGYNLVRKYNTWLANQAGVPVSVRCTTVSCLAA